MGRTVQQSEYVKQLMKYRDEGAELYWHPEYDTLVWATSRHDRVSLDIWVGGYPNFVESSGYDTLDGLPGDKEITATIEIPDRGPGRPRERKEPCQRSTIDLPVSIWHAVDRARGTESRRVFIEAAIQEKLAKKIDQNAGLVE